MENRDSYVVGHVIFERPELTGRDVAVRTLARVQQAARPGSAVVFVSATDHRGSLVADGGLAAVPFPAGHGFVQWLRAARGFARVDPRRHGVTVLHFHGCRAAFLLALLRTARRPGWRALPAVYSNHGIFTDTPLHLLSTVAEVICARRADAMTACNEDQAATFRRFQRIPVWVVTNGADPAALPRPDDDSRLRRRLGIPAGAPVVSFVGRLSREKRPDLFVDACRRISQVIPETHFILAGEGAERNGLRERLASDDLTTMHMIGFVPEPAEVYAVSDLLLHPADFEGMPLVVLEAMASGVPVVGTAVAGLAAIIDDDRTGVLVGAGDADGLANAAIEILRSPKRRREMALRAAAAIRSSHTADHMREGMASMYRSVIAKTPGHVDAAT
ncbi:glycosyltransferase family 4 protein [Streptomyces griseorubiginosus]|uniref:glycosyltransferase family 4 protein n=1 Tax=Streptomyces TaxID=1883 RepID=UPI003324F543